MHKIVVGVLITLFWACDKRERTTIQASYDIHCGSCHVSPKIDELPNHLWSEQVLPEMAARMGIKTPGYDALSGMSFEEYKAVLESGIFPSQPTMDKELYKSIERYIIEMAPDSLTSLSETTLAPLNHYRQHPIIFPDSKSPSFTYLKIREGTIELGDIQGGFFTYNWPLNTWNKMYQFESPVVGYAQNDSLRWALTVGLLNPSERSQGRLYELSNEKRRILQDSLHRPVYLHVSENTAELTITIAEFGHFTGRLSAMPRGEKMKLQTIVPSPGALRVYDTDINGDDHTERLVLFAQGDERLVAIRNLGQDRIEMETLLRFSPVSGVSWFEVSDVDGDGYKDIITVHGDNADRTYVQKPYHGVRIHKNDGNGKFTQVYNHPMNGATRVVATDWDMDGDPDLAVVAAFPDYSMETPPSFILLENTKSEQTPWKERSIQGMNKARWFLMDSGDLDHDGDQDLVLGVFNYLITPVPDAYMQEWKKEPIGLLILENTRVENSK